MAESPSPENLGRPLTITRARTTYDFTSRFFPSDLGIENNGHYVIFNINVPARNDGSIRTNIQNSPYRSSPTTQASVVDSLRGTTNASTTGLNPTLPPGVTGGGASGMGAIPEVNTRIPGVDPAINAGINLINQSLSRNTKRIRESIAIFMPSAMAFTEENRYEDISLTAFAMKPLGVGLSAASGMLGGLLGGSLANQRAARISDPRGGFIGQAFSIAKMPINPRVEVLFSHRPQRQFVFEFMMAPKNEQESENIRQIVNTFRYHAAPEVNSVTPGSLLSNVASSITGATTVVNAIASSTLIPPAEFDIAFYKDGAYNTKLPFMNTCVLERIEVDYSPTGVYSTFSNGYPVAVRLSLAFREIEVLHKQRIAQGF